MKVSFIQLEMLQRFSTKFNISESQSIPSNYHVFHITYKLLINQLINEYAYRHRYNIIWIQVRSRRHS
jgi:hypothetical protein